MVFICFVVYVLGNNTRVVPYCYCRVWSPVILIYTASKFGILDDFCVKKRFLQVHFDPFHNNQPCIKIGKSSKLFMHDCPIPMCASCAVEHIA